jgi:hypothetical protein
MAQTRATLRSLMRATAVTGLLAVLPATAIAQSRTDFSGTWTFDASQTEVTGRIAWPAELVISQTATELSVEGRSARQRSVENRYRLDGSEVVFPPDASGVTVRARAAWTGDRLTVTSRRSFNTAVGEVSITLTEVYGRTGDTLTVERGDGNGPAVKVVYHKGTAVARGAAARPPRPPRTATGPIPRTPDSKPDLQGYWTSRGRGATDDIEPHPASYAIGAGPGAVVDPQDGMLPIHPWVPAERQWRAARLFLDPEANCFPAGIPRMMYGPMPFQVIYFPDHIVMLFDSRHVVRTIRMNSRTHLTPNIRLWMGDSIGYWEGDTLVVESTNFNGKTWLDMAANMVSDSLNVVERIWLIDENTMAYEATLTDPKVYTRPWTMAITIARNRDDGFEILEGACHEGNLDVDLLRRTSEAK